MSTYVIDQIRSATLLECIAREPNAFFIIPDVAFVEMSKHPNWEDTMRSSLKAITSIVERTFLSLSLSEAMKIEIETRMPIGDNWRPVEFQGFMRSLVQEFNENREGPSKHLIRSKFVGARSALLAEDLDASGRKTRMLHIVTNMIRDLKPQMLKALRNGSLDAEFKLIFVQANAYQFAHDYLVGIGGLPLDEAESFLAMQPVLLRYTYALFHHAVTWVVEGGLPTASDKTELNHLLDMEYAVIATYFDGLITEDNRAINMYNDLSIMLANDIDEVMQKYSIGLHNILGSVPEK